MSDPTQKAVTWLMKVGSDLTEDGPFHQIELWHTLDGEPGEKLDTFIIPERWGDGFDPNDAAQEIWDLAQNDADSRGSGSYRYTLLAYRLNKDSHETQYPFRITAGHDSHFGPMGGPSESPTEKGVMAQTMRHQEVIFNQQGQLLERTVRRCDLLESGINRTLELQQKLFLEHQGLLDRKHERELEIMKEQKRSERMDIFLQSIMPMLHIIAGKFLQGSDPGLLKQLNAGSPRDEALRNLFRSFTPEQAEEITKSLGQHLQPQQMAAFFNIYKSYASEEPEHQEEGAENGSTQTH